MTIMCYLDEDMELIRGGKNRFKGFQQASDFFAADEDVRDTMADEDVRATLADEDVGATLTSTLH